MIRFKLYQLGILLLGLLIVGCSGGEDDTQKAIEPLDKVTANDLQIVTGQTVFVPAYAEIFHGSSSRTIDLTVTLAIHNTDANNPIIIQSVNLYDTEGNLTRNYVDEPLLLKPLGTTGFVVDSDDDIGGFGANFVVEWIAEEPVFEPVIEGIMINTSNQQGLSFITTGRILSQINVDSAE